MKKLIIAVLAALPVAGFAQQDNDPLGHATVTGSIQSDILIPSTINDDMPEHFLTNTYVDLRAMNKHLDTGIRFEYLEHPLPGFEKGRGFDGCGIANAYIKLFYDKWDLTMGSFYEQFGSGFILRTYQERSLGIDNSLLGGRLSLRPYKGISLKVLSGTQRTYWDISRSLISGVDGELNIDEWIPSMSNSGTFLSVGGSWVNKYEDTERIMFTNYYLNLPRFVNAWDARVRLQTNGFSVLAEYARKGEDPGYLNDFIYRPGDVAMLSMSYSKKGLSALLQAKRSENMTFRSLRSDDRKATAYINHLPAFTLDHTYSLAALYPYATQADGEWAYQAELAYKFKKGTALGGKYGTSVKFNASYVRSLDIKYLSEDVRDIPGSDGYTSSFFKWGDSELYHDFNIQIEKKFSKTFKLNFMYMNQMYNQRYVEGHGDLIHSNIFIADGMFQLSRKTKLRAEAQYLQTKDAEGDWVCGLLELSLAPHFMFTLTDMWNCGVTDEHYYQGSVTFNWNAHRLQAGYGRTREGFNCTGGVCRRVPETKGVTLSYNYTF